MNKNLKEKIALLCDIELEAVVSAIDAPDIYMVPLILRDEGLDDLVVKQAGPRGRRAGPNRLAGAGGQDQRLQSRRCASRWWANTYSSGTPT